MAELIEVAYFSEDVAAMTSFYKKFLGAEPAAQSEDMAIFMVGNTKIFIHRTYQPREDELPPENHFAYGVEDVDAACRELIGQGLTLEVEPQDYYWGRSAYLRDPDGNLLEVHKPQPYEG